MGPEHQSFNASLSISLLLLSPKRKRAPRSSAMQETTFNLLPDDVVDQPAEERLRLQISIVLLGLLLADVLELHRAKVVAARLEAGDDLAHEAALDAVGLDHDEGGLHFVLRVVGRKVLGWGMKASKRKVCDKGGKKNDLRSPSLSLSQHFFFSLSEKGGKKKEERALVLFLFSFAVVRDGSGLRRATAEQQHRGGARDSDEARRSGIEEEEERRRRRNDPIAAIGLDLASSLLLLFASPEPARPRPRGPSDSPLCRTRREQGPGGRLDRARVGQ